MIKIKKLVIITIKLIAFVSLFMLTIHLLSSVSIVSRNGDFTSVFYLSGGFIIGFLLTNGLKYSLAILPSLLINHILSYGDIRVNILAFLVYFIFLLNYTLQSLLLNWLPFKKSFSRPIDFFFLIFSSLLTIVSFGPLILIFAPESIGALFIFWFTDLIGIITIVPLICQTSDYMPSLIARIKLNLANNSTHLVIRKSITSSYDIYIALISLPLLNQASIYIFNYEKADIFYIAYLSSFWFVMKGNPHLVSLTVFLTNILFFINRKYFAYTLFEIQFVIITFTLTTLVMSTVIRNRNVQIIESNESLEVVNSRLTHLNTQLKVSNEDLERFAYIASHDLQEPLRAIIGYLQLFDRKYGNYPDEKSKKYITTVIEASEMMQRMINDLLTFSRVGTRNQKIDVVDLNQIVNEVKQMISKTIEDKHAEIVFEELPKIYGNYEQIKQLFLNLVSNSLKYCKRIPHIEITAIIKGKRVEISVSDNGIGMDKVYFDKIFIIFQRLHSKHEYSGSGIGLSICKKIVERHGGNICVESTIDEGSKFKFTLPVIEEQI